MEDVDPVELSWYLYTSPLLILISHPLQIIILKHGIVLVVATYLIIVIKFVYFSNQSHKLLLTKSVAPHHITTLIYTGVMYLC